MNKIKPEDIIDEICTCGHLKSLHGELKRTVEHGVIGLHNGACNKCNCVQYTWVEFILRK